MARLMRILFIGAPSLRICVASSGQGSDLQPGEGEEGVPGSSGVRGAKRFRLQAGQNEEAVPDSSGGAKRSRLQAGQNEEAAPDSSGGAKRSHLQPKGPYVTAKWKKKLLSPSTSNADRLVPMSRIERKIPDAISDAAACSEDYRLSKKTKLDFIDTISHRVYNSSTKCAQECDAVWESRRCIGYIYSRLSPGRCELVIYEGSSSREITDSEIYCEENNW